MKPWWEAWPGRVEHEYQCLDAAGIRYAVDEAAAEAGVLQLRVSAIGDEAVDLVATFPDLYPFFRPAVQDASGSFDLTHHVAPFGGDLCLLGRRTDRWSPTDTLSWLLTEQLPKTRQAGAPRDAESDNAALDALEERQAEPFTEYYSCFAENAMILIDGAWELPPAERHGTLDLRLQRLRLAPDFTGDTLGAVLRISADDGTELAAASGPLTDHFTHPVPARWVRLDAPVAADDPVEVFAAAHSALEQWDRSGGKWDRLPWVQGKRYQALGVVFPEERQHRASGDGWVFLLRVQHDMRIGPPPSKKRGSRPVGHIAAATETHMIRAGYAGRSDMAARVPELTGLAGKHVLLLGLGALGGTVADQLARAGLGELTTLDRDVLEPVNLVRHVSGLQHAGWAKAAAIKSALACSGPHTQVNAAPYYLGAPGRGNGGEAQQVFLADLIDKVDLVIDCTAEKGVHRAVAWLCESRSTDLLVASASNGGWGGRTVRLAPRPALKGCWTCLEHALDDGTMPAMPAAPDGPVQDAGCADPTFTGTGFDLAEVALHTARVAVGMLQRDTEGGYPEPEHDVQLLALRDAVGAAVPPTWTGHPLPIYRGCGNPRHSHP